MCAGDQMERRQGRRFVGYKLWHTGGDGRWNGMGIIVLEEISKASDQSGKMGGIDSYGMGGDMETNGVLCRYMGYKQEGLE